jgi:hypothetical protein
MGEDIVIVKVMVICMEPVMEMHILNSSVYQ